MSGKITRSVAERFWEKVDVHGSDECWVWTAARDGRGLYGVFYRHGRLVGAHVASYELAFGPVPAGLQVDHQCNNPSCVNPSHLQAMTGRDNVLKSRSRSANNARKTHCPLGHAFTGRNVRGERICHECMRIQGRAAWGAKKLRTA